MKVIINGQERDEAIDIGNKIDDKEEPRGRSMKWGFKNYHSQMAITKEDQRMVPIGKSLLIKLIRRIFMRGTLNFKKN